MGLLDPAPKMNRDLLPGVHYSWHINCTRKCLTLLTPQGTGTLILKGQSIDPHNNIARSSFHDGATAGGTSLGIHHQFSLETVEALTKMGETLDVLQVQLDSLAGVALQNRKA